MDSVMGETKTFANDLLNLLLDSLESRNEAMRLKDALNQDERALKFFMEQKSFTELTPESPVKQCQLSGAHEWADMYTHEGLTLQRRSFT
jgi:hypothetical protein